MPAGSGSLPGLPSGVLARRVARRERRAQRDAPLGHQLEDFRRAAVAVLDGVHAGQEQRAASLSGCGMNRNRPADAVRGLTTTFISSCVNVGAV